MRMGIMGGTLDPVHNGHLEIAQAVRQALELDGVLLLPAGDPPHKKWETDKWDRLEMARRAAAVCPGLTVSDMEVLREGTTFTVDTLTALSKAHPQTQWVYIVGADTLNVLESWRRFDRVAELCEFAAVGRPGVDTAEVQRHAEYLRRRFGAKITFLDVNGPDVSSTEVRSRVAEGNSIEGLVPESVAAYIREKGLYLCAMPWRALEQQLAQKLKPGRYLHTLGVADTAQRLAGRYGVDPMRARLAGMLHDCAKWMAYGDMVALVRRYVPDADEEEIETESVLHAPAGAVVAWREYGVRDREILSAIRKHTLGGPEMTALEALIYVADFIEPNRKPFDGLEGARALAEEDVFAAARRCARLTSDFVLQRGGTPHPRTMQMLENEAE